MVVDAPSSTEKRDSKRFSRFCSARVRSGAHPVRMLEGGGLLIHSALFVRYSRDFRDDIEELKRVVIATPTGAQIPISEVAKVYFSRGPAMIRDEDGLLTGSILGSKKLQPDVTPGFCPGQMTLGRERPYD
jgi:hypothetical protein